MIGGVLFEWEEKRERCEDEMKDSQLLELSGI